MMLYDIMFGLLNISIFTASYIIMLFFKISIDQTHHIDSINIVSTTTIQPALLMTCLPWGHWESNDSKNTRGGLSFYCFLTTSEQKNSLKPCTWICFRNKQLMPTNDGLWKIKHQLEKKKKHIIQVYSEDFRASNVFTGPPFAFLIHRMCCFFYSTEELFITGGCEQENDSCCHKPKKRALVKVRKIIT